MNSIWAQLASLAFLFAAIFNDILLIRFCLVLANFLLIVASLLGWPLWPNLIANPFQEIALDTFLWSLFAFILHFWAFFMLLVDERRMKRFSDANSESLYQFFLKRTGISRKDFLPIIKSGKWTRCLGKQMSIPTDVDFHLLVEGFVDVEIEGWKRRDEENDIEQARPVSKIRLYSGEVFDLRLANVFDVPIGFFNTSFAAQSSSDEVLLFSWDLSALNSFASSNKSSPVITQAWRNLIAFSVADIAHRPWQTEAERLRHMKGNRHVDFSIPSEETEPKQTWKQFFWWIIKSMDPR
jgi:hypothetical protein